MPSHVSFAKRVAPTAARAIEPEPHDILRRLLETSVRRMKYMRWYWRPWTIGLPLTTGLITLVFVASHLSAQAPPLSSGVTPGDVTVYEASPKLFAGPKGETLRLS